MLDSSLLIFIQIVSESFPVSSSGHTALAACVIAYYNFVDIATLHYFFASPALLFAHIPTLGIVTCFFRFTWWPLMIRLFRYRAIIAHLIFFTIIADGITALCYFLLPLHAHAFPLQIGFVITAALLWSLRWCRRNTTRLSLHHMILLGFVQSIALLPGISRFGTVYVVCRWLGIRSIKAFNVAWMLQWPLMIAGVGLGILRMPSLGTLEWSTTMLPIVIASIIAYGGLYLMYCRAEKNDMWQMSIYMIVPIFISFFFRC